MPEPLRFFEDHLRTPIGEMLIATDTEGNLRAIDWVDYDSRMRRLLQRQYGKHGFTLEEGRAPHNITHAIEKYFAGDLAALDTLPIKTAGTPFQRKVWTALRKIPCGATISYGKLAAQIGHPAAVRAVGLANGSNPIGVVVPCHRVIGSDGSLTGFGGGLPTKRYLLSMEDGVAHGDLFGMARDIR